MKKSMIAELRDLSESVHKINFSDCSYDLKQHRILCRVPRIEEFRDIRYPLFSKVDKCIEIEREGECKNYF